MALTIPSYSDNSNNTYSASYWYPTVIRADSKNKVVDIVFTGWKDLASFASDYAPIPGGSKQYHITDSDFDSIASEPPNGTSLFAILGNAAESYALAKLDTDSGTKDESGNPIMTSFFNGAIQS